MPSDMAAEELHVYFGQFGEMENIHMMTGQGSCILRFIDPNVAELATAVTRHEVRPGVFITVAPITESAKETITGKLVPKDWTCDACGDVQFARNFKCRKCGKERPADIKGFGAPQEGDWECPACGDFQFARNMKCRKCRTPKPGAERFFSAEVSPKGGLPGDWICKSCGDLQFARNTQCRRCHAPKVRQERAKSIPGNWHCSACGDENFANRSTCRNCGTGKPSNAPGFHRNPDDWDCPMCGDLQFARNMKCRKCGTPKEVNEADLSLPKKPGLAAVRHAPY